MIIKVPQVIDVLMKYGSFARPLVNWALSNDKLNSAWREYFKALKYDWQKKYTLELKCIDRGIKRCKDDKTVKYMLMDLKLSVLQSSIEYRVLRKEKEKIQKNNRSEILKQIICMPIFSLSFRYPSGKCN